MDSSDFVHRIAAKELAKKLPSLAKHDYNTIDMLMKEISKKHRITGKALHDIFLRTFRKSPDDWIKSKLSEVGGAGSLQQEVDKFVEWACGVLHLKNPPKVELSNDTEEAQTNHHTGGHTDGEDKIWVYAKNRNLVDILRTTFHELVHVRQGELNMIKPGSSYPGSPIEAMADMLAGKYIKIYGERHHEIFENSVTEAPLADYQPLGDFNKPGPFRGPDKKLIPHPVNQLKTQKFLSNSPYDFRLFFSNISGTGRYSEYGPMKPEAIKQIFTKDADQIINGSADAITIVYVGNSGDRKVPLTPWVMAHRFGHAIKSGHRRAAGFRMGSKESGAWPDAEEYFFSTVNQLLDRAYSAIARGHGVTMKSDLTAAYNSLFNALGTQRSSRSGAISRPNEFLYELFAQYIKDGKITLNPLPTNLGYGRQNWGTPSKYMNLKQDYRDESTRQYEAQGLADDLSDYFGEVLRSAVGQIYVM